MTNEETILAAIDELSKSQQAFIAEWRATRDEARTRTKQILAESEQRRQKYERDARRAKFLSWVLFGFLILWLIGPMILSAFLFRFNR